jgi:hypothetical protein
VLHVQTVSLSLIFFFQKKRVEKWRMFKSRPFRFPSETLFFPRAAHGRKIDGKLIRQGTLGKRREREKQTEKKYAVV